MSSKEYLSSKLSETYPALSGEILDALVGAWTIPKKLQKGQRIDYHSVHDKSILFVVKGALKVCYNHDGRDLIFELIHEGQCFINISFFDQSRGKEFYVEAIKNTELIGIRKSVFRELINEHPVLQDYWESINSSIIINCLDREIELLTPSPKERFDRLLNRRPELFQRVPMKYIATYLNLTPETISRLQKS